MKKSPLVYPAFLTTLFCWLSFVDIAFAQSRHDDAAAAMVRVYFNADQAAEIYGLTAEAFRAKMTRDQFVQGMSRFRAKAGEWKSLKFKEENDKGIDYLADFASGQQVFSIQLDGSGKISRLNFAPIAAVIRDKDGLAGSDNPLLDSTDRLVESLVRPYIQKGNTSGLLLAIVEKG